MRTRMAHVATTVAILAFAGCSPSSSGDVTAPPVAPEAGSPQDDAAKQGSRVAGDQLSTLVVGYEVVADREQRILVGLLSGGESDVVSFGEVDMAFYYRGTQQDPLDQRRAGPTVRARFLPLPGSEPSTTTDGPRVVTPSEGLGVYGAEPVRLDEPGFWEVEVSAEIDGEIRMAPAAPFPVLARSFVPASGEAAPRTEQPLAGAPGVAPGSLDSRAGSDGPVPDPVLHDTTVADAIEAGRPTLLVVSTPTYCVSRFCGPITESVEALAEDHADEMAFVHLEVWKDYEAKELNPAAAEWIAPEGVEEVSEPWVFLIGADGTILDRWDNVATDADLAAAVERVVD